MNIHDIEKASEMKAELSRWQDSIYNIRRLISANEKYDGKKTLSQADEFIFNKIRLWFDSKKGKHEIQCGQPAKGNYSGCSEKFEINAEQLKVFCEYLEGIAKQKEEELLKLIGEK